MPKRNERIVRIAREVEQLDHVLINAPLEFINAGSAAYRHYHFDCACPEQARIGLAFSEIIQRLYQASAGGRDLPLIDWRAILRAGEIPRPSGDALDEGLAAVQAFAFGCEILTMFRRVEHPVTQQVRWLNRCMIASSRVRRQVPRRFATGGSPTRSSRPRCSRHCARR
jgi:hypothetical protein